MFQIQLEDQAGHGPAIVKPDTVNTPFLDQGVRDPALTGKCLPLCTLKYWDPCPGQEESLLFSAYTGIAFHIFVRKSAFVRVNPNKQQTRSGMQRWFASALCHKVGTSKSL